MAPAVIHAARESDIDKRTPFRTLWLLEQVHPCFVRKPITLAGVAGNTGAHDILPSCLSTAVAWQDMVYIQVAAVKMDATVLTGVLVALKYVVPCELYLFFWQTVKQAEHDDSGYPDT